MRMALWDPVPFGLWSFGQDQEQTSELPSHKNHLEDGTQSLEQKFCHLIFLSVPKYQASFSNLVEG